MTWTRYFSCALIMFFVSCVDFSCYTLEFGIKDRRVVEILVLLMNRIHVESEYLELLKLDSTRKIGNRRMPSMLHML